MLLAASISGKSFDDNITGKTVCYNIKAMQLMQHDNNKSKTKKGLELQVAERKGKDIFVAVKEMKTFYVIIQ